MKNKPMKSTQPLNEKLSALFEALGNYATPFAFLNAVGYGLMYFIASDASALVGIPWQAILIVIASILSGLLFLISRWVFHNGWTKTTLILFPVAFGILLIFYSLVYAGIFPILIALAWIIPIAAIVFSEITRQKIITLITGIIISIAIIGIALIPIEKLQFTSVAASMGFLLLIVFVVAVGLLIVVTKFLNLKSLRSELTSAFLILVILPSLVIAIMITAQAYLSEQLDAYNLLDTKNTYITNQVDDVLSIKKADIEEFMELNSTMLQIFLTTDPTTPNWASNKDFLLARSNIKKIDNYEEIFLLDYRGRVVLSTIPENVGTNFASQSFFTGGLLDTKTSTATGIPQFGGTALMTSSPYVDPGGITRGVVVFRSTYDEIYTIIANSNEVIQAGGETYLLDKNQQPITETSTPVDVVTTTGSTNAVKLRSSGFEAYTNYANVLVNGAYGWNSGLEAALISEVPVIIAQADTIKTVAVLLVISIMAVIITAITVLSTSRDLVQPIENLTVAARQYAGGDLSIRYGTTRIDEIGALAVSFNTLADQLQGTVDGLEKTIEGRMLDIQRQATRLRVAAEVARDTTGASDLSVLLNRSTQVIRERFGFYHCGIFLIDSNQEYAVLSAATGDSGKIMIETGHKLKLGEGIVGTVGMSGEARIALDTGLDAIHFRNPLLPSTRSEMAVPLKAYNRVIGVLDVQSEQANAFQEEDIAAMQLVADQLAVAIDSTRVFEESEKNLRELQRSYQQYTRESWKTISELQRVAPGYVYEGVEVSPINEPDQIILQAIETGSVTSAPIIDEKETFSKLVVPIKLRGQTIGAINLKFQGNQIDTDVQATIEETVSRISQNLETSRLILQSRLRAERESALSNATGRIGSTVEYETIMKSAVEELTKLFGDTAITIQMDQPEE